jgi:CheY-like chemotaxis protein
MGGSLKAKSKPGRGSIFYFTLPFGIAPKKKAESLLPKAFDLKGLRVLVVDDNQSAGNMLKEALTSFRFETHMVTSGKKAIEFISNDAGDRGVDLIMLDWKLPEEDGVMVLKRIRKQIDIPVIMMTAFGREQIMRRAKEAGASAFLVKPIKHSVLLDTILEVFGRRSSSVSNGQPAIVNEIPVESHVSGSRILVVDDNSINRQLACEFLVSGGVVADTANDGRQALDALEKTRYDAVLMDVQMPEMDGYEATRRIRRDDRFRDLPVIAMTAAAMQQDMDKCFECGMDDYLSKPIDTRKLFSLLNRWIKPRNNKKEVEVFEKIGENANISGMIPDMLPGLDIIRCMQRMGGNETLLIGLLKDFAGNHSSTVKQIRESLKKGEEKTAQRTAHNLKGVAAVFSADDLHDAALALELSLKTGETEKADDLLEELETAFNQVMAGIEILTGNHSDAVN